MKEEGTVSDLSPDKKRQEIFSFRGSKEEEQEILKGKSQNSPMSGSTINPTPPTSAHLKVLQELPQSKKSEPLPDINHESSNPSTLANNPFHSIKHPSLSPIQEESKNSGEQGEGPRNHQRHTIMGGGFPDASVLLQMRGEYPNIQSHNMGDSEGIPIRQRPNPIHVPGTVAQRLSKQNVNSPIWCSRKQNKSVIVGRRASGFREASGPNDSESEEEENGNLRNIIEIQNKKRATIIGLFSLPPELKVDSGKEREEGKIKQEKESKCPGGICCSFRRTTSKRGSCNIF